MKTYWMAVYRGEPLASSEIDRIVVKGLNLGDAIKEGLRKIDTKRPHDSPLDAPRGSEDGPNQLTIIVRKY